MASPSSGSLSAPLYLAAVVAVTLLGVGTAMALRPAFAHQLLGLAGLEAAPQATAGSFYATRVQPLFAQHCVSCHGELRQKAGLRLDSFAATLRGGRHGAVIVPGDVKASELMTRITLPAGDDKAMPPEGKAPLSPDDVTVIRLWIAGRASPATAAIKGAPRLVAEVTFPPMDDAATARRRAPLAAAVAQLSARYPGLLAYEARNSANLELNATLRGAAFRDFDLKAFLPLKDRLVLIDLSGTAITEASRPVLVQMKAAKIVRLFNTKLDTSAHD